MNIFEIKSSLANIFAEIEENDGELTPELEVALRDVNESLQDKVEGYVAFIKNIGNEINLINAETARLRNLKERREKLKERIEKILVEVIIDLGDTKKSGVKYIDYGTGEVSVRKSQSVEINDYVAEGAIKSLAYSMQYLKETNQLDVVDRLDADAVINYAKAANYSEEDIPLDITEDDLEHMSAEITFKIPVEDLLEGKAYKAYSELLHYTNDYKIKPSINKTELKKVLIENGVAAPNLAKLNNNQSLILK